MNSLGVIEKYTKKLLQDVIAKQVAEENNIPDKQLYIATKVIKYLTYSPLAKGDMGFIYVAYNLYYNNEGVFEHAFPTDIPEYYRRGMFIATIAIPFTEAQEFMKESVSEHTGNIVLDTDEAVMKGVIQYVREHINNMKGFKVAGTEITLTGANNDPKMPIKMLKKHWLKCLNKSITPKVIPVLYSTLLNDGFITKDKKQYFKVRIVTGGSVKDKEGNWKVSLNFEIIDVAKKKMVFNHAIFFDTGFIYNVAEEKKTLDILLKSFLVKATEQITPVTHGSTTISLQEFTNLPIEADKIKANASQTTYVLERVSTLLSQKEDSIILNSEIKHGVCKLTLYLEKGETTMLIGGNGLLIENLTYYREGNPETYEGNKDLMLQALNKTFGVEALWLELIHIFDFRRKIKPKAESKNPESAKSEVNNNG